MQTVFIKFSTHDDRVRGFYELATKARVGSFPDEIYQVPVEASSCSTINRSPTGVPRMSRSRRPMTRFEILLPLFYNDGRPIEPEKFVETDDELVNLFGAVSTDSVTVRGLWLYQGTLHHDRLLRARVDVEDRPENWQAIRELKQTWKARFKQLDIWITAHRIEIV